MRIRFILLIFLGITSCQKHEVIPIVLPVISIDENSISPVEIEISQDGETVLSYSFSYDDRSLISEVEEIHYKTTENDTVNCFYDYHSNDDLKEKKWEGYINAGINGLHEWVDTKFTFDWEEANLKVSRIEESARFNSISHAEQLDNNVFVKQDLNNAFFSDTIYKEEINSDVFRLFSRDFFVYEVTHNESQLSVTNTFGNTVLIASYPKVEIPINTEVQLILRNLFLNNGEVPKDETISYLYSAPYSYINPFLVLLLKKLPTRVNDVDYSYYLDLNNRLVRLETSTGLILKFKYMDSIHS